MDNPDSTQIQIEQEMVAHFIGKIPDDCDRAIVYVMQRDGLWERRINSLGTFTQCIAPAHVPGLPVVLRESFELAIPRIPTSVLWEAIAFFREIYFQMGTEAALRVIYDTRRNVYFTECPPQVVSRASVGFDRQRLPFDQCVVADIHSHGSMHAKFSSVDDADELADRFYGVIGCLDQPMPQISFRVSIGGNRMRVPLGSLFALEDDPVFSCGFPQEWLGYVTQEHKRSQSAWRKKQLELSESLFDYPSENEEIDELEELALFMDDMHEDEGV